MSYSLTNISLLEEGCSGRQGIHIVTGQMLEALLEAMITFGCMRHNSRLSLALLRLLVVAIFI